MDEGHEKWVRCRRTSCILGNYSLYHCRRLRFSIRGECLKVSFWSVRVCRFRLSQIRNLWLSRGEVRKGCWELWASTALWWVRKCIESFKSTVVSGPNRRLYSACRSGAVERPLLLWSQDLVSCDCRMLSAQSILRSPDWLEQCNIGGLATVAVGKSPCLSVLEQLSKRRTCRLPALPRLSIVATVAQRLRAILVKSATT